MKKGKGIGVKFTLLGIFDIIPEPITKGTDVINL